MGILDDILAGSTPAQARAGTGPGAGAPSILPDITNLLGAALGAGAQVFSAVTSAKVAKTAAKAVVGSGITGLPQLPQLGTGNMTMPAGFNLGGGGAMAVPASLPTPVTGSSVGSMFTSKYPSTVQYGDRVYVNRGRALLYSGDLAACRRVAKIARRAHRAVGRHRPR